MKLVVDSSALIAIVSEEPEASTFKAALADSHAVIGCPTILEVHIWLTRQMRQSRARWLEGWLASSDATVVAFDRDLERLAARAYDRFGKGRHPAALNFGDCMSYAVARHHDAPLLFKGSDFGRTDVDVHEASVGRG